jgi:XTP/dITP diphosphohydrolase
MDVGIRLRSGWVFASNPGSGDLREMKLALLVATRNKGKLKELHELLRDLSIDLRSLDDFPRVVDIAETGATFIGNATLKAIGYATETHLVAIADDSGLEVEALGGSPGVFSARYAGEGASDSERITKLLAALLGVPTHQRAARFVSALVIANAEGQILNVSVGKCEGKISLEPCGSGGFGYDPVFIPNGYEKTFAELSPEIKNQISHRGIALLSARDFLRTLTAPSSAG